MPLTVTHIEELLEPGAQALGYDIVAVEMAGGDRAIVRVYIDKDGGVDVEDCARASHQFGAILDVEDPISNRYTLEVSSPGLDRPLAKPVHFEAAIGQEIKVKLHSSFSGRKRFKGTLMSVEDGQVELNVDGEVVRLDLAAMDKARLVPDYNFNPLESND